VGEPLLEMADGDLLGHARRDDKFWRVLGISLAAQEPNVAVLAMGRTDELEGSGDLGE